MSNAFDASKLNGMPRLLLEVDVRPVQGDRFQPTGFADLGAGVYQLPDGTRMLLVESAQSMANRLESALIGPDCKLVPELEGLPYIVAKLGGETQTETNSLLEAHRLNSPFIIFDQGFAKKFTDEANYHKFMPLDWRKIAAAIFKYDANAILHGVFLANLEGGRIKMARALSAFIEARGVREAVTGGVKNNPIDPTGKLRAVNYDKDVYGNVPYQRVEFTAEKITAFFNLDLGLLRSYALGDEAFALLTALALYKIRVFLDQGLRLRTACDLRMVSEFKVEEPVGFVVPDRQALLAEVQKGIRACSSKFVEFPGITVIETKVEVVKKGKAKGSSEPDETETE